MNGDLFKPIHHGSGRSRRDNARLQPQGPRRQCRIGHRAAQPIPTGRNILSNMTNRKIIKHE